jgi:cation transport regulator ChaC
MTFKFILRQFQSRGTDAQPRVVLGMRHGGTADC